MDGGFITTADLPDGIHPADLGYKKMATKWHQAIGRLETNGWLVAPTDAVSFRTLPAGRACARRLPGAATATLAARPRCSRPCRQASSMTAHISTVPSPWKAFTRVSMSEPDDVWFAQVVSNGVDRGGELDDRDFSQSNVIYYRENTGSGSLGAKTLIPTLTGKCAPAGIRWGDVNNDGLDDFI
jgi:hypothetical protein